MKRAQITLELPELTADSVMAAVVRHYRIGLDEKIGKILNDVVRKEFDAAIAKQADKAVSEFLKKTIPQTNTYGEATGQSIGVTEYIVKSFEKYMQQRVRSDGSPADSYGTNNSVTRHQWLIQQFGLKEIEKIAAVEITKVRQAAEAQVSAAVGAFIAKNLVAPVAAIALPKHNS